MDGETSQRTDGTRAYAPSWVDWLKERVSRLPGQSWLHYLGIGLVLLLIQSGVLWGEGLRPVGTFLAIHAFLAGMIVLFPALIHFLDKAANTALSNLRPVLEADQATYETLRYRLTTLPWFLTLLSNAISATVAVLVSEGLGTPAGFDELASGSVSSALIYTVYVLAWWMWGTFIYHTVHQLRAIDHILTEHTRINLFSVRALYAFSGVTAVSAASLTIPSYVWLAINRSLRDPTAIAITLPVTALAVVAFVWPQLGVRRLLAEEKGRMLDALNLRREAAIVELRQRVDERKTQEIDALAKVFAALEIEENALNGVSTWPWRPETVRYLMSALFLPLAMWLVQFIVQGILNN